MSDLERLMLGMAFGGVMGMIISSWITIIQHWLENRKHSKKDKEASK